MPSTSGRDVIAGCYGFGNFGDDLFREVLSEAISRTSWARPTITQARPRPLDKVARNLRAVGNVARARSITLGGGSILGARPPFGIRHVEVFAARTRKLPYCAIGVGILENLPTRPDDIIERMSWIGLRSEREFEQLSPHVHYTSDIAYVAPALLLGGDEREAPEKPAIAVIPAEVGELGQAAHDPAFLDAWIEGNVRRFSERGYRVDILVLQPSHPRDAELGDLVLAACQRAGVEARVLLHEDALQTLRTIASCAFVFTDRLHGAIVSHICGIPFRLSKHHQKCADLLADLRHPDAPADRSFAADSSGAGISSVEDWSGSQGDAVTRHADLANAGIAAWLEHVRERVS